MPLTLNLYMYCGGNPINFTDPTGHSIFGKVKRAVKRVYKRVKKRVKRTVKKAVRRVRHSNVAKRAKAVKKWAKSKYRKAKKKAYKAAKKAYAAAKTAIKKKATKALAGIKAAAGKAKAAIGAAGRKIENTFAESSTLNPSAGSMRTTALGKASNIAGPVAGAAEVMYGIGVNIYSGASAKETFDDAVVDATFVTVGIAIGMVATMLVAPAIFGVAATSAAAVAIGIFAGFIFSIASENMNLKGKYKKAIGV